MEAIEYAYLYLGYDENSSSYAISFSYDSNEGTLPITELGTPTQMQIPTSNDYPAFISESTFSWLSTTSSSVMASDISVVSGDATQTEYGVSVTGDCSLNIKVVRQD